MDKKSAKNGYLWHKLGLFFCVILLSSQTFAYREIHPRGYVTSCTTCCTSLSTVRYYGPDCNCYYYGTDCSKIIWINGHWDVYGHYIPGYWLTVNR